MNYSSVAINLTSVVPSVEILWNEQILNLSRLFKIVAKYCGNIFELIKNKLILNALTLWYLKLKSFLFKIINLKIVFYLYVIYYYIIEKYI